MVARLTKGTFRPVERRTSLIGTVSVDYQRNY